MSRPVALVLVALALLLHAVVVAGQWRETRAVRHGADFASYHYAVRVAAEGHDPYDRALLGRRALAEGTRPSVHPYFYPPPFLLAMVWTLPLELKTAYHAWFWLDELAALVAVLLLAAWWRPLGPAAVVAAFWALAISSAVPNNHGMGQVNLPVLALVIGGLWADEEGRPGLGGALLGAACMAKMSPALLVAWWLVRARWTAAFAACATGAVLTVVSLPLVAPEHQLHFYRDVLPLFASGDYNGLRVPIHLFANHSIPNVFDQVWPGRGRLSGPASLASRWTGIALLLGLGALLWKDPRDGLARAGQVGAVMIAMLLLPVYTYEHHLVWAIPSVVAAGVALASGRLGRGWIPVVGLAVIAWAMPLELIKLGAAEAPALRLPLQEAKFAALLALLAANVVVGRS